MPKKPSRIKFLSTIARDVWLHQLPNNDPVFNECIFIFDKEEKHYDWLVVYDDLPRPKGIKKSTYKEELQCHPENTILITQEPSSIKYYGDNYTDQFGHVITSQAEKHLPHRNRHYGQPSLFWFYGVGNNKIKPYNELVNNDFNKNKTASVVWSNKKQLYTAHYQRLQFLKLVREKIDGLDVFGRGEIPLDDKADALNNYKYHIAIENFFGLHHWTEKLADPFLGLALPFYYGCPNLEEYFPKESFIRIDIFQPEKSLQIIESAIENNEYEKRLPYLVRAKESLIKKYNLFVVLTDIVNSSTQKRQGKARATIKSRKLANKKNFLSFLNYIINKTIRRISFLFKNIANKQ